MRMSKDLNLLEASLVTHLATGLGQLGRGRPAGTVDGMSACGLRARLELPDSMAASGRLDFVHGRQGSTNKARVAQPCWPSLGRHGASLPLHPVAQSPAHPGSRGRSRARLSKVWCVQLPHRDILYGPVASISFRRKPEPLPRPPVCPAHPRHLGLSLTTLPRPLHSGHASCLAEHMLPQGPGLPVPSPSLRFLL